MDRELSPKERKNTWVTAVRNTVVAIGLLYLAWYGIKRLAAKKADRKDFHIAVVERGDIKQTLTATGQVIPYNERVINAPVTTEIQDIHINSGTEVDKGDLILSLDQQYTALEYERLKDELALRRNNISRLKLEFDKDLRDIDYRDQIKGLQLEELNAQLTDQERLLQVGGATEEELEAAKLQLNIAKIEKKVLENELDFKRNVNTKDKENLQLEYNIQAKRLKELESKLNETQVKAPQNGVITWLNENIGSTVNEGEPLVRIAELDAFKIEASTSDRNNDKLQIGLPVVVRIGKERLNGQINRILPEIINNTVRFLVTLDQKNHPSLRPNLRTDIQIIIGEKTDVLKAKRGNGLKGNSRQVFYKIEGEKAVKVSVEKGLISTDYFEIVQGLKEGDQLIVSETDDFDHMDSFIIEK